ncbi:RDD family protein [Shewanella khirikhana]|uniref:RDD family protein n=1 Tax=Shewanella khirikhana TaxID=1965282 RepID=A0ABM7D1M8_9GAMM|nr:RDD family protein [Shewanella khirikhana]AZQ10288.1 RDD family protein [Shewanella khirikhana]
MTEPSVANSGILAAGKDPRTIITPHAFSVAEGLLYTPLASPLKRGIAICIDGLLISVLAEDAGVVFVALVLLTSYLGKRLGGFGRWAKIALYTLMTVVMIYAVSDNFTTTDADTDTKAPVTVPEAISVLPKVIALSLCDDASCAQSKASELADSLAASNIAREDAEAMLFAPLDELDIPDLDKAALKAQLTAKLQQLPAKAQATTQAPATKEPATKESGNQAPSIQAPVSQAPDNPALEDQAPDNRAPESQASDNQSVAVNNLLNDIADKDKVASAPVTLPISAAGDDSGSKYSLIEWAKGILNDLGLGFGWAAFYFTVFTAWFDGQTLGKKLMGIRVISLDGSKLGLWDAFGRYGGYGAGFATGLLGFMQVFWDANRQAIQDKISATVVIDLTKPRLLPGQDMMHSGDARHE